MLVPVLGAPITQATWAAVVFVVVIGVAFAFGTYFLLDYFFKRYGTRLMPAATLNKRLAIVTIAVAFTLGIGGGIAYGIYLVQHP